MLQYLVEEKINGKFVPPQEKLQHVQLHHNGKVVPTEIKGKISLSTVSEKCPFLVSAV
jgi:hypothetical protein